MLIADMKVLAVQNIECETLGLLENMLRSDGFEIERVNAQADQVPLTAANHVAVVILGGPMAVYHNLDYLQREQDLIKSAISSNTPVLGICLGSQLIAQAGGGQVFKGTRKEIGLSEVSITAEGHSDIFHGIAVEKLTTVFQWHGDTYTLPANATILAKNDLYPQAFRIGSAIGIQFHLEVTEAMIERWIHQYRKELDTENIEPSTVMPGRSDLDSLGSKCKIVYRNLVSQLRPRR